MSESADQWLSGGDCSKCRRQNYCHKQCKANERFVTSKYVRAAIGIANQVMKDWASKKDSN